MNNKKIVSLSPAVSDTDVPTFKQVKDLNTSKIIQSYCIRITNVKIHFLLMDFNTLYFLLVKLKLLKLK